MEPCEEGLHPWNLCPKFLRETPWAQGGQAGPSARSEPPRQPDCEPLHVPPFS